MKFGDMSVAILIVAIVLIIIPIPSGILDVLLAINISAALIILLNVIYSREALQISVFPSFCYLLQCTGYLLI